MELCKVEAFCTLPSLNKLNGSVPMKHILFISRGVSKKHIHPSSADNGIEERAFHNENIWTCFHNGKRMQEHRIENTALKALKAVT